MPRAGGRNKLQPIPKKELSKQIVSENQKLGLENVQLKDGIKDSRSQIEISKKELSELKSEINKNKKILKSSSAVDENHIEAVKSELEKTNSTLLDIQRESVVQRNNLDNIHSEFSEKIGLLEKLDSEIETSQKKAKLASHELLQVVYAIETKSEVRDSLNKEIKLARKGLDDLREGFESESFALDKKLDTKKVINIESIKGLEEKKSGLKFNIEKLNGEMGELHLTIEKETSQQRIEKDRVVKDRGMEKERLDAEIEELKKEIYEKQSQLDSVIGKHDAEKVKFEQTQKNVHQFKIDIADEISRQKNKQKLSNIDVAGLADALK